MERNDTSLKKEIAAIRKEVPQIAQRIRFERLEGDTQARREKYTTLGGGLGAGVASIAAAAVAIPPLGFMLGGCAAVSGLVFGGLAGYGGGSLAAEHFEPSKTETRAQGIQAIEEKSKNHVTKQMECLRKGKVGEVVDFILNVSLGEPEEVDIAYQKDLEDSELQSGALLGKVSPELLETHLQELTEILRAHITRVIEKRGDIQMTFEGATEKCTWSSLLRSALGHVRAEEILLNDSGPSMRVIDELAQWLAGSDEKERQGLREKIQNEWQNVDRSEWKEAGKLQIRLIDFSYGGVTVELLNALLKAGIGKFDTETLVLNYSILDRMALMRLRIVICEEGAFPRLKSLFLKGNKLGGESCRQDIEAIRTHLGLRVLDYSANETIAEPVKPEYLRETIARIQRGMPGEEMDLVVHSALDQEMEAKLYEALRTQIANAVKRRSDIAITLEGFSERTWGELLRFSELADPKAFLLNNQAPSEYAVSELAEQLVRKKRFLEQRGEEKRGSLSHEKYKWIHKWQEKKGEVERLKKQIQKEGERTRWEWAMSGPIRLRTIDLSGGLYGGMQLTVSVLSKLLAAGLGKFDTEGLLLTGHGMDEAVVVRLKNAIVGEEKAFPRLKSLNLSQNLLEGKNCLEAIQAIANYVSLKELDISNNLTLGSQLQVVANKRSVVPDSTKPLEEFLYAIPEKMPRLEYLGLRDVEFRVEDETAYAGEERNLATALAYLCQKSLFLKYVDLRTNPQLGTDALSAIADGIKKSALLKWIILDPTEEYNAIALQMEEMFFSRSVQSPQESVSIAQWNPCIMASLKTESVVTTLSFGSNRSDKQVQLNKQDLRILKKLIVTDGRWKHVKKLDLSGNDFISEDDLERGGSRECLENMVAIVSHLGIEELNVSNNPRLAEDLSAFQVFLRALPHAMNSLKRLQLRNVGLHEKSIAALAEAIRVSSLLEHLDLRQNRGLLGCETMLVEGLKDNISLKILVLDGTAQSEVQSVLNEHKALFAELPKVNGPRARLLQLLNYKKIGGAIPPALLDFLSKTAFYDKCLSAIGGFIAKKRWQLLKMPTESCIPISEKEYVCCHKGTLSLFYKEVEEGARTLEGESVSDIPSLQELRALFYQYGFSRQRRGSDPQLFEECPHRDLRFY